MSLAYSSGINIKDSKRKGQNTGALGAKAAQVFTDTTKSWLDAIKKTPTGGKLLEAIDNSGHTVDIYRTWGATDGNYQSGGGDDEYVYPFDATYPDGTTVLHHVLNNACEDLSGRSKAKKFFGIGKPKPRFLNRDAIARLAGVRSTDLKAMERGRRRIDTVTDSKLKVYLYDFLVPGPGLDCFVVFNYARDNLSEQHKKYLPMSHNWAHRPPGVALAHELIHAWRVVSGMVLFPYGWEEEAMTVGLPPFSNMELTENKVRVDWGRLAIRPDYQTTGLQFESGLFDENSKIGISMTNKAWQGDQSALHAEQSLAQTAASRRRAMGYDDDDSSDEDDDWVD